jgi:hypothetical protein
MPRPISLPLLSVWRLFSTILIPNVVVGIKIATPAMGFVQWEENQSPLGILFQFIS